MWRFAEQRREHCSLVSFLSDIQEPLRINADPPDADEPALTNSSWAVGMQLARVHYLAKEAHDLNCSLPKRLNASCLRDSVSDLNCHEASACLLNRRLLSREVLLILIPVHTSELTSKNFRHSIGTFIIPSDMATTI